jgi:CubicO group peptidase (beta-lactamase class C family)
MSRLFALGLLACVLTAAPADTLRALRNFDETAQQALARYKSPGAAVGIIQDGKVIFAKGYGYRDLKTRQPVTTKTVFATGSVSKSFTAAALATLVDEGKLDWDKPVREYLPWFGMYDPVATELINVRDMLSHRSGLPRHDFIRFSTRLTREELVKRIRYLEPNRSFRDTYQYNNLMYTAAGFLGGVLAGTSWEDLVESRIFKPLGMTRSTTSTLDMQKGDDFAKPHLPSPAGPKGTDFYVYQDFGVGPNGAVNSCVEDLLKYLQMYLDDGKPVLSRAQLNELWKPVTVAGPVNSYALGWQTGFYRGHRRFEHGGAITGFRAHVMILPEQRAGIVALINTETSLATYLAEELSDRVLGLPSQPRPAARPQAPGASVKRASAPISRPLEDYAGTYSHPAYGTVRVEAQPGVLRVRFDAATLALTPTAADSFEIRDGRQVQFRRAEKEQVREMLLPLEPAVKPFVFLKD